MAEDNDDDGKGDGSSVSDNPAGHTNSTSFEDAVEEEAEIVEPEQKILAKIICVPGANETFIVNIMKQVLGTVKDTDNEATITAASGMVIKQTKDFPKGKKFSEAFNPIQSYDAKTVKMIFELNASPSFRRQSNAATLASSTSSGRRAHVSMNHFQDLKTNNLLNVVLGFKLLRHISQD